MLTLRELDSRKVFTANHDAVRSFSLSQPDVQLPAVPTDLQLFDMSVSRPEAGSRDSPNADIPYHPEVEDASDPVIQSMSMSLPNTGLNTIVSSLLDLQCSPPFAVLLQSRSFRVRFWRRPRAVTLLDTSMQADVPSLLSIPASSPIPPIFDDADSEFPEPRSFQRKQTQL